MLPVQAPDEPGDYVIEVDVVCERVAWLSELGNEGASVALSVSA